MSTTQFGVTPQWSSPASKRMREAGERFASRSNREERRARETERALELFEIERLTKEACEAKARLRRRKALDRFERAWRIMRASPEPEPKTMSDILLETCEKHGFTKAEIRSRRRYHTLVVARHEAMYRCRMETAHSLPEIGRFFGGFDHTTCLHAIHAHEQRMQEAT